MNLASKKLHPDFEIYELESFLSAIECAELIQLIETKSEPSRVTLGNGNIGLAPIRNSSTALFPKNQPEIQATSSLIDKFLNIDANQSENLQGQKYEFGQHYSYHQDWFSPSTLKSLSDFKMGNRTFTFMVYLNDDYVGGETHFPRLNLTIKPKAGKALYWNNLDLNGEGLNEFIHAGTPVNGGVKYIITKWYRQFSKENITMNGNI